MATGGGGGAAPRSHNSYNQHQQQQQQPSSSARTARADPPSVGAARGAGGAPGANNVSSSNGNNSADGVCRCGEPASVLVTKKAGPNMGRQFYACRKPRYVYVRCLVQLLKNCVSYSDFFFFFFVFSLQGRCRQV